jgi:hypothetical protein
LFRLMALFLLRRFFETFCRGVLWEFDSLAVAVKIVVAVLSQNRWLSPK